MTSLTAEENTSLTTEEKVLDWDTFLAHSQQLTHFSFSKTTPTPRYDLGPIEGAIKHIINSKFKEVKQVLKDAAQFWPQFHIDGIRNVWIFKPSTGSAGVGISIMDKYDQISGVCSNKDNSKKGSQLLAQKYIERPLCIFDTKFDIRQWFMITSWSPLTVWIYAKCYLRFSSKLFSLEDLDRRIHLTNNSVQSKFQVDPFRNPSLPSDNMWSCEQFQDHLENIGKPHKWKDVIWPGIKSAIISALLACRDSVSHREGSFHIQGADFMLSDDFKPWLIEINSRPSFVCSTKVTSKLVPLCVEDTFKVILDLNENPNADTGDWELLYKGRAFSLPPQKLFENICIQGKSMEKEPESTKHNFSSRLDNQRRSLKIHENLLTRGIL